jgi:hypothetical protein
MRFDGYDGRYRIQHPIFLLLFDGSKGVFLKFSRGEQGPATVVSGQSALAALK